MTFRFRAAAALDLQRKREDDARRALAQAESAVAAAVEIAESSERALAADAACFVTVQSAGAPAWLIAWHRTWMARQRTERDRCRAAVAAARETAASAAFVVRDAHRRRRTLERLRDRAWRRYQIEIDRRDLRQINELAGLRFVARGAADKGESDGEHEQHRPGGGPVGDGAGRD